MTKRWYRSPRGKILGVATGLAEWRDLLADPVRLIVFLAIIFTGFFPGAIIYLIVALCLPANEEDYQTNFKKYYDKGHIYKDAEDATFYESKNEKSNDDLRAEYETLKKKVEEMENEMFDKERDWDARFNSTTDK